MQIRSQTKAAGRLFIVGYKTSYHSIRHNTSVWRTDRRTDIQPIAISCAVWLSLTHVKNPWDHSS